MTKKDAIKYLWALGQCEKKLKKEKENTESLLDSFEEDDPETEIGSLPGSPPPPPPPRP